MWKGTFQNNLRILWLRQPLKYLVLWLVFWLLNYGADFHQVMNPIAIQHRTFGVQTPIEMPQHLFLICYNLFTYCSIYVKHFYNFKCFCHINMTVNISKANVRYCPLYPFMPSKAWTVSVSEWVSLFPHFIQWAITTVSSSIAQNHSKLNKALQICLWSGIMYPSEVDQTKQITF